VPHAPASLEMINSDWEKIQTYMGDFGRPAGDMSTVYNNWIYILKPGEDPQNAVEHFSVYSGMDLPYWQEYYLCGEAEEIAEKIAGRVKALGGCEWIALNPITWKDEQLDMIAHEVLPMVEKAV